MKSLLSYQEMVNRPQMVVISYFEIIRTVCGGLAMDIQHMIACIVHYFFHMANMAGIMTVGAFCRLITLSHTRLIAGQTSIARIDAVRRHTRPCWNKRSSFAML
ncbi:hypothetical protein DFH94DRAFT_719026 [Russula ochroleuca]|uniref:Uncharacterized protein n=1 Tax=Russula ochroleuca TaxID=152965 RepID=A0A9P5N3T6_9AGAM|nr:hypothetical protein DFH94DRAFT_719026 [Russula ochroleuca]